MNKLIFIIGIIVPLFFSCGSSSTKTNNGNTTEEVTMESEEDLVSSDWDKLINEYETLINQYISLLKKASNNDLSAMAECANVLAEIAELQQKIDNVKGDLTPSQIAKFSNLMVKAAEATNSL